MKGFQFSVRKRCISKETSIFSLLKMLCGIFKLFFQSVLTLVIVEISVKNKRLLCFSAQFYCLIVPTGTLIAPLYSHGKA